MELGKHVVDKALLDRYGRRAGMVDDLLIELPPDGGGTTELPEVTAILTGPLVVSLEWPRPFRALVRLAYRLLGVSDPQPIQVPWEQVTAIDVVVHVDVDREEVGLMALPDAVARRFISRIPGS